MGALVELLGVPVLLMVYGKVLYSNFVAPARYVLLSAVLLSSSDSDQSWNSSS